MDEQANERPGSVTDIKSFLTVAGILTKPILACSLSGAAAQLMSFRGLDLAEAFQSAYMYRRHNRKHTRAHVT
jgi:hypothetical protein